MHDYHYFLVWEFSKEEAMVQFCTVQKKQCRIIGGGINILHMKIMAKYIILMFVLVLHMKVNLANKIRILGAIF